MTLPHPGDLQLIPLTLDESGTHSSFALEPRLQRHDGALYGGTAIAASICAMEAASQREVLWITTQFVAPAPGGSTIEMRCETLASGRRTAQLRVTATIDGEVMFASLGSTGTPRPGGLAGQFESPPSVTPPESSVERVPIPPRAEAPIEVGWQRECEHRVAEVESTDRTASGTMAMWTRFRNPAPMTPARIAFSADMVPVAIARGAGRMGAGTSLDNSMRFAGPSDTDWVLLELQGNMAAGGYGHGLVRVWSQSGRLLAVGSQTASMTHLFDED